MGVKEYQLVTIRAGSDRWGEVQTLSGAYLYILSGAQGSLTCDGLSASPIGDLIQSPGKEFRLEMTCFHTMCEHVTEDEILPLSETSQTQWPAETRQAMCPSKADAAGNEGQWGLGRTESPETACPKWMPWWGSGLLFWRGTPAWCGWVF